MASIKLCRLRGNTGGWDDQIEGELGKTFASRKRLRKRGFLLALSIMKLLFKLDVLYLTVNSIGQTAMAVLAKDTD